MRNGYFDDPEREYVIENMYPRRPLKNYLWNEGMLAELDQFGFGSSKACIEKQFRTVVAGERLIYIKDRDSGEFFDANRNFLQKEFSVFRARVGQGYHVVESVYLGIKTEFTVLVPQRDFVEMHKVKIRNESSAARNLCVYTYLRPFVNLTGVDAYGRARYDEEMRGIRYTYRGFRIAQKYTDVFYAASMRADSYDLSDESFIGTYRNLSRPQGIDGEFLSKEPTVFEPCYAGVLQFEMRLQPNEEKSFYFAAGTAREEEECRALARKYANGAAFEKELRLQKETNEKYIEKTMIKTPDSYLDSMVNIYLKRQMTLGKTWGRVYGKGFRDVLQDIAGFVSLDPEMAREKLLNALTHQFISGNALRMFDPILDYPYQDMPVWIPPAVLAYLKESGDFSLLEEEIPYYDDERKESVFLHVKRGMEYLFRMRGERGLSLWGGGDWNDSLDNCGMKMKGESVWLSIAAVRAAKDYLEIVGKTAGAEKQKLLVDTEEKIEELKAAVLKYGFEGDHFLYGYNDWGEKVGSDDNREGKIFLNVQTWAVMSDLLPLEKKQALMDTVERRLKCDYGYLQNDPPYETPDDHLGRLTYFSKGVYENGSVYNHGVMFKAVADCCIGRGDNALETLRLIRCDNPANPDSGVEPYAVCNMYFGPSAEAKKGFAPQAWITGSAGWMYRAVVEYLLGIKADFDGLAICPCMPSAWDRVEVTRTFRGVVYRICFLKSEKFSLTLDGKRLSGNKISLCREGSVHDVICRFR